MKEKNGRIERGSSISNVELEISELFRNLKKFTIYRFLPMLYKLVLVALFQEHNFEALRYPIQNLVPLLPPI